MFGLCSLRTNSCCCGVSLRTGTITILILNLIGGLIAVLDYRKIELYGSPYLVGYATVVIIELFALYGTFKRKPDFIIPHLVIHVIYLIAFLLTIIGLLIFIPFARKVLGNITYVTPDGNMEHIDIDAYTVETFYLIYAIGIVILLIIEAIGFHFFKVVLSHYYELKTVLLDVNPTSVGFKA